MFFDDSLLKFHYDSLMNYGSDGKTHSWGHRKLFNEHLIDVKGANSTFYADFLPDFTVGKNLVGGKRKHFAPIVRHAVWRYGKQ